MKRLLIRFLVPFAALLLARWLLPEGFTIASYTAAAIFAVVLAILNAIVRPILGFLTFPITILTLGLFHFVLNAAMFALAAYLVGDVQVNGFIPALVGALLVSVVGMLASILVRD